MGKGRSLECWLPWLVSFTALVACRDPNEPDGHARYVVVPKLRNPDAVAPLGLGSSCAYETSEGTPDLPFCGAVCGFAKRPNESVRRCSVIGVKAEVAKELGSSKLTEEYVLCAFE